MEGVMGLLAGSGILLFMVSVGAVVVLLVVASLAGLLSGAASLASGLRMRLQSRGMPEAMEAGGARIRPHPDTGQ
ncbi:MAG: hypothetical protein HY331_01665 [Chloroflexi bacterium]|nr:hypothetical protein [Chloroflexota bacterium]